jgi:hypothetical protein
MEYNKFMKGVDRADQYLSYYPILRKTMKWSKKVVLWLINCALFNAFRVYNMQNPQKKMTYRNFLINTARIWASDNAEKPQDEVQPTTSQTPTGRTPKLDPPGRLSGDMKKHTLESIVGSGKKKFPTKPCKVCSAHKKRSETRYICSFCKAPLHKGSCFQRYHTLKHY